MRPAYNAPPAADVRLVARMTRTYADGRAERIESPPLSAAEMDRWVGAWHRAGFQFLDAEQAPA